MSASVVSTIIPPGILVVLGVTFLLLFFDNATPQPRASGNCYFSAFTPTGSTDEFVPPKFDCLALHYASAASRQRFLERLTKLVCLHFKMPRFPRAPADARPN